MLRLLHTSDWHLGQQLKDRERTREHEAFLRWLEERIARLAIDAVLVAGDVFDVANPSAAAQRLFYEFVARVRGRSPNLQIVVIAGNHDSPSRIEAPSSLCEAMGVQILGRIPWSEAVGECDFERLLVPLRDASGRTAAWCLAVPFLRPGDLPCSAESGEELEVVESFSRRLTELALCRREPGQALVAMSHAAVQGALDAGEPGEKTAHDALREEAENEAVRPTVFQGAPLLPARIFAPELAYVALGHLHRASRVAGREVVRYSGSPFPLSFAERTYRHQVVYVELEGDKVARLEPIPVPRPIPMVRRPDRPLPIEEVLSDLRGWDPRRRQVADLESGQRVDERPWLEVPLLYDGPLTPQLIARIDEALEGKVTAWTLAPHREQADPVVPRSAPEAATLDEVRRLLDPVRLLEQAWQRQSGTGSVDAEVVRCLEEMLATEGI